MGWSDDPEVSLVERGDDGLVEALRDRDDGCIGGVETGVGVGVEQFDDPAQSVTVSASTTSWP